MAKDFEDAVRLCRGLPGATEDVKWGDHLCFLVGGKIFVILALGPEPPHVLSLKASPEAFETLTGRPEVVPAPYLARGKWIALRRWDALPKAELADLLRRSYELVRAGLPRKARDLLERGKEEGGRRRPPSPPR